MNQNFLSFFVSQERRKRNFNSKKKSCQTESESNFLINLTKSNSLESIPSQMLTQGDTLHALGTLKSSEVCLNKKEKQEDERDKSASVCVCVWNGISTHRRSNYFIFVDDEFSRNISLLLFTIHRAPHVYYNFDHDTRKYLLFNQPPRVRN